MSPLFRDQPDTRSGGVHRVEMQCVKDSNSGKPHKKVDGCVYRYKGQDAFFLKPGTYTIWHHLDRNAARALACKVSNGHEGATATTTRSSRVESFDLQKLNENEVTLLEMEPNDVPFKAPGLRYTAPNGS